MAYQDIINKNQDFITSTWAKLDKKLSLTAERSRYKLPFTTINGVHDDTK